MCVLIFSTILSETLVIIREIRLRIVINVRMASCNVPVILVGL